MKKLISVLLASLMVFACVACGTTVPAQTQAPAAEPAAEAAAPAAAAAEPAAAPAAPAENLSAVQQIIKEAEGMTLEELAKKAESESASDENAETESEAKVSE